MVKSPGSRWAWLRGCAQGTALTDRTRLGRNCYFSWWICHYWKLLAAARQVGRGFDRTEMKAAPFLTFPPLSEQSLWTNKSTLSYSSCGAWDLTLGEKPQQWREAKLVPRGCPPSPADVAAGSAARSGSSTPREPGTTLLSVGIPGASGWKHEMLLQELPACSTSAINRHQLEAANQSAGFLARSHPSAACRERIARNSASGAIWPP